MSFFLCLIMRFFPFYLFSCFFYFWKTPLTSYPFNFLLLLTLEPFTLCFILIELSIRCICHGLFLQQKLTSHLSFTFSLISSCKATINWSHFIKSGETRSFFNISNMLYKSSNLLIKSLLSSSYLCRTLLMSFEIAYGVSII